MPYNAATFHHGKDKDLTVQLASFETAVPTSVCRDFLLVMKKTVSCIGLLLPALLIPKLVSHIRGGFYGSSNPAQAEFVSTGLPDIFRDFLLLLNELARGTVGLCQVWLVLTAVPK